MLDKNKIFGIILGISHFFTDAIASFILVTISLGFLNQKTNLYITFSLLLYFILYNFLAFGGQSIIGYFLDKVKNNYKYFITSKKIILISFLFYLIALTFIVFGKNNLSEVYFILSVTFVGLASAFFHIGAGNISLLSNSKKATILGFFASGGVVGLSFGAFLAVFYDNFYFIFYITLIVLGVVIFKYKN